MLARLIALYGDGPSADPPALGARCRKRGHHLRADGSDGLKSPEEIRSLLTVIARASEES